MIIKYFFKYFQGYLGRPTARAAEPEAQRQLERFGEGGEGQRVVPEDHLRQHGRRRADGNGRQGHVDCSKRGRGNSQLDEERDQVRDLQRGGEPFLLQ